MNTKILLALMVLVVIVEPQSSHCRKYGRGCGKREDDGHPRCGGKDYWRFAPNLQMCYQLNDCLEGECGSKAEVEGMCKLANFADASTDIRDHLTAGLQDEYDELKTNATLRGIAFRLLNVNSVDEVFHLINPLAFKNGCVKPEVNDGVVSIPEIDCDYGIGGYVCQKQPDSP